VNRMSIEINTFVVYFKFIRNKVKWSYVTNVFDLYSLNIKSKLLFQLSFGYHITFDNLYININPITSRSFN
jgi:hypothetical protein